MAPPVPPEVGEGVPPPLPPKVGDGVPGPWLMTSWMLLLMVWFITEGFMPAG